MVQCNKSLLALKHSGVIINFRGCFLWHHRREERLRHHRFFERRRFRCDRCLKRLLGEHHPENIRLICLYRRRPSRVL